MIGKLFSFLGHYVLPAGVLNFHRAGRFLHGALRAHQAVYTALKKKNSEVEVGITHQYLRFIPTSDLLNPVTKYLTNLVNETALRYLESGKFLLKMPFCHIEIQDEKPETDFVGLQNYGSPVIGFSGSTSFHEPITAMPLREDPERLYEALVETYNKVQKPIRITENGISNLAPS
jgi:beta-glucosidase/6-phospho-beta-glucosidase/beta-galactosidase